MGGSFLAHKSPSYRWVISITAVNFYFKTFKQPYVKWASWCTSRQISTSRQRAHNSASPKPSCVPVPQSRRLPAHPPTLAWAPSTARLLQECGKNGTARRGPETGFSPSAEASETPEYCLHQSSVLSPAGQRFAVGMYPHLSSHYPFSNAFHKLGNPSYMEPASHRH